jgi:tetratricopeptide (TPR) repeat protein
MSEDDDAERPKADDATLAYGAAPRQNELTIPGYRILRSLGAGGMGTVYLAEDEALGRRVAIKIVSPAVARDPAVRARFLREARLLATIEHPNVVRVYSFGASEERAWLVMEYVEGDTLADHIRAGPIALGDARATVCRVIDALAAAWEKKIVHRDIKPSNILFDRRGDVKVADFGLAKGGDGGEGGTESSLTQTGYILGSPHYVAPEQAQGHEADFRADIYSLGVTLFEMLTGRRPFEGQSAMAIIARHLHEELPSVTTFRRDAGREMADLVAWMTAKDRDKRPASYEELRDAMKGLDEAQPAATTRAPRRSAGRAESMARRAALATAGLCLAAAAVLFVLFSWRSKHPPLQPAKDERLVVAVAPFWGPDEESAKEGQKMAALIQQAVVTRLRGAARVIGIDETKSAVRDTDSARALGERVGATAVIWGQAFVLRNETEIQPSLTLVPRRLEAIANFVSATGSWSEVRGVEGDLPSSPEAVRLQSQSANQIELRKTSAEGIGDLVTFVAAMHLLSTNEPQRALELLTQTRRTPDALYQKAVCLTLMLRDEDAARELQGALLLDPAHAQSLALLADIDARALRFADAAAHLRAAAAGGHPFTTSEAALYNGTLYAKERYPDESGVAFETPTLLAIDPLADHVLERWELPGAARGFSVDDAGMTVRCDVGPPRRGELTTLHFANGRFQGPPLPHTWLLARIRRMRAGWYYPGNFMHEFSGPQALKVIRAHFRYSPIEANPALPATLPDLKAGLEKRIARDPSQPWHRMYLALTTWELGDHAGGDRLFAGMLAQPNSGTPYYEFSWMARQLELLGHPAWADAVYVEALKRRRAEPQPITATAMLELLLGAPFVRGAAGAAMVAPNPPRQHLWLLRARELCGLAWEGDDLASDAWARWLGAHGDSAGAAAERTVHETVQTLFGGERMALTLQDLARAAQMASVIALLVMLGFTFTRRGGLTALARNERTAVAALAMLLLAVSVVRVAAAARSMAIVDIPIPISDDLAHPAIVASLDQVLARRDSDELRFITAVAHHMAGDTGRAAELYRTVPTDEAAENLNKLDLLPLHFPTAETYAAAFHTLHSGDLRRVLDLAWVARPPANDRFTNAAYDASQVFYLALLLAAAVLLFVAGIGETPRVWPARRVTLFVFAVAFLGIALTLQRVASFEAKLPVSGKYSGAWLASYNAVYPFPPDPTAESAVPRAMARSEAMRLFWLTMGLAGVVAVGAGVWIANERVQMRKTRPFFAPDLA